MTDGSICPDVFLVGFVRSNSSKRNPANRQSPAYTLKQGKFQWFEICGHQKAPAKANPVNPQLCRWLEYSVKGTQKDRG